VNVPSNVVAICVRVKTVDSLLMASRKVFF